MALQEFTFSTLDMIDGGRVATALQKEIQKAVMDVRDRPGMKKPRVVTLQVMLSPAEVEEGTADVESAEVQFRMRSSYPERSIKTVMAVQKSGRLLFNDLSPRDPRQKTIDE